MARSVRAVRRPTSLMPRTLFHAARVSAATLALVATSLASANPKGAGPVVIDEVPYDHYLPSKWNTVSPGVYSAEYEPRIRVKSGDTVKIDTRTIEYVERVNKK